MLLTKVGASSPVYEIMGMDAVIIVDGSVQLWCRNEALDSIYPIAGDAK